MTAIIGNLFETIPCPLCFSSHFQLLKEGKYGPQISYEQFLSFYRSSSEQKLLDPLVQCDQCQLVYLNPRVKSEIIMESYSSAQDEKFIGQNPLRIKTFTSCLKNLVKEFHFTPDKKKVILDVGCAGGAFPKAAHDLGFSVIGVEPAQWLCNYAKKTYQLDIRPGILQDQNFAPASFDMVTLWDVIEHLTEPQKVLTEVNKILKDQGLLVVNFPDYDSLTAKILKDFWPFLLSVHLIYFTPKTIEQMMEKVGFKVLRVKKHWQILQLGYILDRAGDYFKIFKLFKKIVEFIGLANLPFAYYLGQKQIIAKKIV